MSDAAVASLVTGLITITTMVVGFLTLWLKLRYGVESKIDTNTLLTKQGAAAATEHAKVASEAASSAMIAAETLNRSLNGELDIRIKNVVSAAVSPLADALRIHAAQDEKNMVEIRDILRSLTTQAVICQ